MTTLSFKVSASEADAIRNEARRARLSVAEFLRRRTRAAHSPPARVSIVRSKHSGARVFSGSPDLPPLTTDTVREMLDSFP
jgi:hypothetical protein